VVSPRLSLKTKLVLAIAVIVAALVGVFAYLYVYQVVHSRITEVSIDGDFVCHEIFNSARQAMEAGLAGASINGVPSQPVFGLLGWNSDDPAARRAAIQQALAANAGLNSLLQSIVGYSPVIYDAAIVDPKGVVLLHTDTALQGKPAPQRLDFGRLSGGGLWHQVRVVYGKPSVYEIRMPLTLYLTDPKEGGGVPFGDIRVGLSTTFMKSELRPQLNHALAFSAISILVSLLLAAGLSNIVLYPLEAIGRRLDRMSAGEFELPEAGRPRSDEYGVVTNKIDRLGRQMRDVKEVFSALKENLDQIMANLQDGVMLFTQDWRVVLVSASAERFAGLPRGEMLGRQVDQVFSNDSPLGRLVLDGFRRRQNLDGQEIETGSGGRVQVSLDFIEEKGESIGALLTMRDAESVRRIEDEIELSRRLAAIGRLTSGVAHEVKNPINAIVVHLEVLREKLSTIDPDARRHMDIIGSEIHRLDRVVQTLVDFTRPVELKLVETDLRTVAGEVAMLASPEAEKLRVHIAQVAGAASLPVKVDTDLLKQALLNVVLNGIQAMPEGGTLTIRVGREDGNARVDICDTGPGIAPEIRERIFNLYFTTKKKGSGIGLAMTYRVMQLHNGSVEFESLPGQGTTFHLRLPLSESRQSRAEEAAAH
jgi:PAS domain S-box-containing protein